MPSTNDAVTGDPLVGFNFQVEVDTISGYFTSAEGLGSESEVIDHKIMSQGTKESIIRKIPGRLTWGDITLKRGLTSNMDFYNWRAMVEQGNVSDARRDGSITMYDQEGTEVARWNFVAGWPSKISGPSTGADSNEVGVEELTIVHEGLTRVL